MSIAGYLFTVICLIATVSGESAKKQTLSVVKSTSNVEWDVNDDDLQKLFEKFFKKVLKVIKEKDPFNYPGFDFNINSYGLICKGYLKDLSFSFFSSVSITHLKVTEKPLRFELDFGFTQLQVIGIYDLDFDFLTMLPLFGKGDIGAAISNINVSLTTDVGKVDEGDVMQLTALNFNLTMQSMKLNLDNLLDNPALGIFVSEIVSDVSPDLLSIVGKLVKTAEGRAKQLANYYLIKEGITFKQVLEFVKQFVQ